MDTERTMLLMQEVIDAWTEEALSETGRTRQRLLELIDEMRRAMRGEA